MSDHETAEPPQQGQPEELLPGMTNLQQAAEYLMRQAYDQVRSGQLIVAELRRTDAEIEEQMVRLREDYDAEIDATHGRYKTQRARLQAFREKNSGVIAYYVGQAPDQHHQPVQVIEEQRAREPQRKRPKTMLQRLRLA